MFEGITGHEKQIELLTKAIEKNKLAHAYVFAGPSGIGKKTIAKKLGERLLESNGNFHPDFLEIDGSQGIKIEQIRELIYKLALKPYQARYKVALIGEADQMTNEAANALLKVLEEPKPYNHIILTTSNPNSLPKTILSRAQKITFGRIDRHQEPTEEINRAEEYLKVFTDAKLADRLIAAYEIADLETNEIKNMLETWIIKLETLLLAKPEKKLANQIRELAASRRFLDQNVNSKLLLTNLMLKT